jgi:chymotrypsin-like protease
MAGMAFDNFLNCRWEIYAGTHDLSLNDEPHRVVVATTEHVIHPDWNPFTLSNDIALIKLPKTIEFSDGKKILPTF